MQKGIYSSNQYMVLTETTIDLVFGLLEMSLSIQNSML